MASSIEASQQRQLLLPQLPAEIVIRVCELLVNDQTSRSCSNLGLTCKRLLPIVRQVLYRKFTVKGYGRDVPLVYRFIHTLARNPELATFLREIDVNQTLVCFASGEFYTTTTRREHGISPRLGTKGLRFLRRLLRKYGFGRESTLFVDRWTTWNAVFGLLVPLLFCMAPNIRVANIDFCRRPWHYRGLAGGPEARQACSNLVCLTISSMPSLPGDNDTVMDDNDDGGAAASDLFAAAPNLRHLTMYDVVLQLTPRDLGLRKLQTMQIVMSQITSGPSLCPFPAFPYPALHSIIGHSTELESFTLRDRDGRPGASEALKAYSGLVLKALEPSARFLKHIELSRDRFLQGPRHDKHFIESLAAFPVLASFTVTYDAIAPSADMFVNLVASCPALRSFTVHDLNGVEGISDKIGRLAETAATGSAYPALRHVGLHPADQALEAWKPVFARGNVQMHFVVSPHRDKRFPDYEAEFGALEDAIEWDRRYGPMVAFESDVEVDQHDASEGEGDNED